MRVISPRIERQAIKDDAARLRGRIDGLERDLARASRCIAELRRSKDARMAEARAEQSRSDYAIKLLTQMAFPADRQMAMTSSAGYVDPPLAPDDIQIDLSGLTEDRVPATANRIDEVALQALTERT